jgi:D-glycero-D-manno-heptose 1,7-bisphosphate phosphatase
MGIGTMSRPAVFLDRDGVLVEEVYYSETGETEAPLKAEHVRLIPGAATAMLRIKERGFLLVLISNQAGFAKGKASLRELWHAHQRFITLLADEDVSLDDVYYSYSHPHGVVAHFSGPSLDRKPGPYNVLIAAARNDIDLNRSWFVGDRRTDIDCALAAGVKPIWIVDENAADNHPTPVIKVSDLAKALPVILGDSDVMRRSI